MWKSFFTQNQLFGKGNAADNKQDNSSGSSLVQVAKFTKTYEDWQPNNTNTGAVNLGLLPAGSVPVFFKAKQSISFTGGTINNALLDITTNNGTGGIAALNGVQLFSPVEDKAMGSSLLYIGGPPGMSQTLPEMIQARLITGDGFGGGVINELTQGSVDIWVWYVIGA